MAIAHDTSTRFPATAGAVDTTSGSRSFTHTPVGTPKGVVVVIMTASNTAPVSGVTYGGTAMTLSASATDTSEAGRCDVYTLTGVTIPTGAQTVALAGATTASKFVTCNTVTAATSLTVVNATQLKNTTTAANPSITFTTTATAQIYGGLHTGNASPASTPGTGVTLQDNADYGALAANTLRRTANVAAGSPVLNVTLTSDDYCMAGAAIAEFSGDATATPSTVAAVATVGAAIAVTGLAADTSRATVLATKAVNHATVTMTAVPANALIMLVCWGDADNGSATESFSVTTTAGLTWTKNVEKNGSPGGVTSIFTAPSGAGGDFSPVVTDSDAFGDSQSQMGVRPVIFIDISGNTPGVGATASDTGGITTTVDKSWVWFSEVVSAGGTSNGTQTVVYTATGFDGGDQIDLVKLNAPTPTHGTGVTITTSANHNAIIEITPPATSGDATATPSVVAGTATVGTVTVHTGETVTAATVAGTVTVGTVAAHGGAGTTPATVAGTATVGTVTVHTGETVSVATVAAQATVGTVSAHGGAGTAPATVAGTATVGTVAVDTGETVSPATVAGVATVGTVTVHAGANPAPATVATVATVGTVSVSTGSNANAIPATVAAVTTVDAVTVHAGASVSVATVAATAIVPAPSVSAGGNATAHPATVAAVAAVGTVTPHAGQTVTVTTVAGVAAVGTVTGHAGVGISPATVACTATVGTVTIHTGMAVTVATVDGTAAIVTPTVTTIGPGGTRAGRAYASTSSARGKVTTGTFTAATAIRSAKVTAAVRAPTVRTDN